jgi:hypothetical protein
MLRLMHAWVARRCLRDALRGWTEVIAQVACRGAVATRASVRLRRVRLRHAMARWGAATRARRRRALGQWQGRMLQQRKVERAETATLLDNAQRYLQESQCIGERLAQQLRDARAENGELRRSLAGAVDDAAREAATASRRTSFPEWTSLAVDDSPDQAAEERATEVGVTSAPASTTSLAGDGCVDAAISRYRKLFEQQLGRARERCQLERTRSAQLAAELASVDHLSWRPSLRDGERSDSVALSGVVPEGVPPLRRHLATSTTTVQPRGKVARSTRR